MTRGKGGAQRQARGAGQARGWRLGAPREGGRGAPSGALAPEPSLSSRGRAQQRQERRRGAVPRNPTVARQVRLSTAASTGMPMRMKGPSDAEALRFVLGPATERSVAPRRQGRRAAPAPPGVLPLPFSRSEAKSCKPEGKTNHRAETSAETQPAGARVCSGVASWPRGDSRAKCTASVTSPPRGGQPRESGGWAEPGPAQRLLCLCFAGAPLGGLAGKLPQPAAEVALELLGVEVAAGGSWCDNTWLCCHLGSPKVVFPWSPPVQFR